MKQLDYQQECALMRYPFKDNAPLTWTNGSDSGVLPNTIFLDAAVALANSNYAGIYILSIQKTSDTHYYVDFRGDGDVLSTLNINTPGLTGINTFQYTQFGDTLRVDIDMDAFVEYFTEIGLSGYYMFGSDNKLCASCYRFLPPKVTQVSLKNTSQSIWNDDPTQVTVLNTTATLALAEGTNLQFKAQPSGMGVGVTSNAGQGLYNGCPTYESTVLTINNTKSNTINNFSLATDGCYSTTPAVHGLALKNACDATCTPQTLINFAHYLNRVTDAAVQLNEYAGTLTDNYDALKAGYVSELTTVKRPNLSVQNILQTNKVNRYYNITCAIYNSGAVPVKVRLTAKYPTSHTAVTGKSYATIGNERSTIADPVLISGTAVLITDKILPPSSTSYVGFILQAPLSSTISDVLFDLSTIGSATAIVDSYLLPGTTINTTTTLVGGLPVTKDITTGAGGTFIYYTNYAVSTVGAEKIIAFTISLADHKYPSDDITNLRVQAPSYFNKADVIRLNANGVVYQAFTGSPESIGLNGFTHVPIDFSKSAVFHLSLVCPSSVSGNQTIVITGNNSSNVMSRTLTIPI